MTVPGLCQLFSKSTGFSFSFLPAREHGTGIALEPIGPDHHHPCLSDFKTRSLNSQSLSNKGYELQLPDFGGTF